MSQRLFILSTVILIAGAGLAYAQCPVPAKHDLDLYSEEQLKADLYDELDDILVSQGGQMEPDEEYSIDDLRAAILKALSDEGDTGLETEIDRCDLDTEMQEAGTTVEKVLDEALAAADLKASQKKSTHWTFVRVKSVIDSRVYATTKRNRKSTPSAAISEVSKGFIAKIFFDKQ